CLYERTRSGEPDKLAVFARWVAVCLHGAGHVSWLTTHLRSDERRQGLAMTQVLKPARDSAGSYASLLRRHPATTDAAHTSELRVPLVTGEPSAALSDCDGGSRVDLFAALYAQLRQIAQSALRRSGPQLTVSPTTLLHEAYLKLSGREGPQFPDRVHFMAYASRTMRTLVIDFVRERRALKRGAAFEITSLPADAPECATDDLTLVRIGEAIDELTKVDAALAELVDLKFF